MLALVGLDLDGEELQEIAEKVVKLIDSVREVLDTDPTMTFVPSYSESHMKHDA